MAANKSHVHGDALRTEVVRFRPRCASAPDIMKLI